MTERYRHGTWELSLLGTPGLRDPEGQERHIGGKSLAILAYLALEGPVSRSQLAGLLWPDNVESTARNNLVHQLRRLYAAQEVLVVPGDVLSLAPEVHVDGSGSDGAAELLAGVAWAELPELHDWLLARRERLNGERAARWRASAQRLEDAGRWADALTVVARLRALNPLSEDALRREMRLHYLLGDPARALQVYEGNRRRRRAALDHEPLPETQALARDIGRGTVGALPAHSPIPPLAQQVGRPPLVGRDAEWAQMEAAWAAGQGIVLLGEPGRVGEKHLALDFLDAHGSGMRFRGCMGDAGLPYATRPHVPASPACLSPNLDVPLWARTELARIVPNLGGEPAPITDEAQKLQFWRAKTEVLGATVPHGMHRMVFDDVQFMDDASIEAGAFVFAHLGWGQPDAPYRTIHCARPGGLNTAQQGVLHAMLGSGLIRMIELGPLAQSAVNELVAALNLPARTGSRTDLACELGRYTGGNPCCCWKPLAACTARRPTLRRASPPRSRCLSPQAASRPRASPGCRRQGRCTPHGRRLSWAAILRWSSSRRCSARHCWTPSLPGRNWRVRR